MVGEMKRNADVSTVDLVGEIERHIQRIIDLGEIFPRNAIRHGSFATLSFDDVPRLVSQKAMSSSFDLVPAIQAAAIFQPMKIITHHGRMIRPSFCWSSDV